MLKMRTLYILFSILFFQISFSQDNCNCNDKEIAFSQAYINTQQLIFRGKPTGITKGVDYGRVSFSISYLFKGVAAKTIDVYFDAKNACALKFNIGEDWLIYANYKQGKPLVRYCSRSKKNIINTNKNIDLMYIKSDITMDEETDKLTELCGLKPFTAPLSENENAHNNIIPNALQRILLIVISLIGFIVIYFSLNRLFKK